jgi:hypothetical protein
MAIAYSIVNDNWPFGHWHSSADTNLLILFLHLYRMVAKMIG